jgi:hypothetical protein
MPRANKAKPRKDDGLIDRLTVHEWAYNDTPGGQISAGQTAAAVPEVGAAALVGLVASGAAGAAALRKRGKTC